MQDLSDHALAALEGRRALLLGRHGTASPGATPAAALALAVETLARLHVQALVLGEPPILPDAEIARHGADEACGPWRVRRRVAWAFALASADACA